MQTKLLRNFYKLTPLQGYKLQKYAERKEKELLQVKTRNNNNVLADENYLSSEHEKDDDSIRNIIEENDEIYEEINYMDTYEEMKDDPERKAFLQEFQEELDRQEGHERKQLEKKKEKADDKLAKSLAALNALEG